MSLSDLMPETERVAVHGWAEDSDHSAQDVAKRFEDQGVSAIVYTDISRDGMMQGVNVEATCQLAESVSVPVIASGGVTDMEDIKKLNEVKSAGIEGVVIGRALYERTISLTESAGIHRSETNPPNSNVISQAYHSLSGC